MVDVTTARRGATRLFAALACLSATPACLLGASAAARADTLQAHYSVTMVGLRVGDIYANGTFEPQNYKIDLNAQLSGLATLVSNTRLALASSGTMRKEKLAPMAYATSAVSSSETRTLRMALKSGTVKAVEIMPPPQFYGERVPITEANKRNILDPTSALIMPVPAGEPLDGPAACNRTLPIYDGYARFDVAMHYEGTREVTVSGYTGPVAVCSARYHPVSGHMVNSRSTAFMANNTGIQVWLAPIPHAHVVLPIRVSLPTMNGQVDIEAVDFQTSGNETATH